MATDQTIERRESGALLNLVGLLYDAAADQMHWGRFLEAAAKHFGAFGANLIRYDPEDNQRSLALLTGFAGVPIEVRGERMQALIGSRSEDPRLRFSFAHPNRPFHCRQILTTAELHASIAYREMLQPYGVEYSMMVTLPENGAAFSGLGFQRRADCGEFTSSDVADLGELVPHLRRALAIHDRLERVDGRRHDAYAVLETLPTGIVILDAGGVVEFANRSARDLVGRRDGLSVESGVLHAYRRSGIDLLSGLLREVAEDGEQRVLSVERPSGRPAFRCLLSRLWQTVGEGLPNLLAVPRVVCFISDPDRPLEAPAEILQRLFGLTVGEARLAERLVAGDTLPAAATSLGIRESTARDRLKSVFAKTETAGQTDLVRTILNTPAWMASQAKPSTVLFDPEG